MPRKHNDKLVSAYPEYRAVLEGLTYHAACAPDVIITGFMAIGVIDVLEAVEVAYYD